ncbi:MAG: hypothetical protein U1E67_23370 [Hyphomicrobiales bacterium]
MTFKCLRTETTIKFARVLVMSTSLTLATVGMLETASAKDFSSVFLNKGYNYCDAKLLAGFWGMSVDQAKSAGGEKIANGGNKNLKNAMAQARQQGRCDWSDTGYGYEDAEALSRYWGRSVDEAKSKVANMFTSGDAKGVARALKKARG